MVSIIRVSIVGFCTYFAFFVFVEIISLITFQVFGKLFMKQGPKQLKERQQ